MWTLAELAFKERGAGGCLLEPLIEPLNVGQYLARWHERRVLLWPRGVGFAEDLGELAHIAGMVQGAPTGFAGA